MKPNSQVHYHAHFHLITASTVSLLDGALLCYFERISAPVIYALSSPNVKCVKLKGER